MPSEWRHRQKLELRQRLYRAAVDLFAAKGYEGTTVQQITDAVGVAKGTFFNHFPTKEHVVAQWYDGITVETLEAARRREPASAEDAICALYVDMAKRAAAAPVLMLTKARYSTEELFTEVEQTQDEEVDLYVREQIEAGVSRQELDPELDVELFVDVLGAVLTGTSRGWVSARPRFDFPEVVRERIRFVFRAARTSQSRRSGE